MKYMVENKIIGSFVPVSFPDFEVIGEVMAKIDTGAYTGALHCTQIREKEMNGVETLYFSPFDHPEAEISATDFAVKFVKSSNGTSERRYFINTSIIIDGGTYPIILSLADRSEMKWPVLIGRRFLRKNHFLVDVSKVNS